MHPLDDEHYRGLAPDWSKVTVPFLSAANWGGQGLHLRGNIEGFTRAASDRSGSRLRDLSTGPTSTPLMASTCKSDSSTISCTALTTAGTSSPRSPSRCGTSTPVPRGASQAGSSPGPRTRGRWNGRSGRATTCMLPTPRYGRRRLERRRGPTTIATGPGATFASPILGEATEITGPLAAKLFISSSTADADIFLVVRVFDAAGAEVVFRGAMDAHTPVTQGWLRASHRRVDMQRSQPYRPYHPHLAKEPLEPGEIYELDVEIWPTSVVLPAGYRIALTVRGNDYGYEGAADQGDNAAHRYPSRGVGPFVHDDPVDRPPEIFGGMVRVHTGGPHESHLLLPVIPAGK